MSTPFTIAWSNNGITHEKAFAIARVSMRWVFIKVMLTRWKVFGHCYVPDYARIAGFLKSIYRLCGVFRCVHNAKNAARLYKFFAGIDLAILRTVTYADN